MYESMGWFAALLLAQWFFGNLYEAVALVPNLLSLIELKSREGEPLFQRKSASPVAYYVPPAALTMVLIVGLTIMTWLGRRPGVQYITTTCVLIFIGALTTVYIVRTISLPLFFEPQNDLARASVMIEKWKILNYARLVFVGASLVSALLWLRTTIRPA